MRWAGRSGCSRGRPGGACSFNLRLRFCVGRLFIRHVLAGLFEWATKDRIVKENVPHAKLQSAQECDIASFVAIGCPMPLHFHTAWLKESDATTDRDISDDHLTTGVNKCEYLEDLPSLTLNPSGVSPSSNCGRVLDSIACSVNRPSLRCN